MFGGVTGFDRHLRLLPEWPWLDCAEPTSVGLMARPSDGVWVQPYPTYPDEGCAA
jgi:hypothetical protein